MSEQEKTKLKLLCYKISTKINQLIRQITDLENFICQSGMKDVEVLKTLTKIKSVCYNSVAIIAEIRLGIEKPVRGGINFVDFVVKRTKNSQLQFRRCFIQFSNKLLLKLSSELVNMLTVTSDIGDLIGLGDLIQQRDFKE